ncbi:arginine repressor [Proteiniclasticum sp. QWL-01]|uniref:arginine repressor n=1 Tax=Proteiniclasticum sp. QWL-01 TaxID=3036945 RepID=UPI00240EDA5E|nr:arginine repressor [Proteiniclasticum sp. QWL-01]WFF71429.1 arginine repressor [Proteiniclasticum sp. QWL-01]
MKAKRLNKILDIITTKNIETQEELAEELRKEGFKITQATISRDIKNLHLTKVLGKNGKYKYILSVNEPKVIDNQIMSILQNSITHVEYIEHMVVIKTLPASAGAVAEAIDQLGLEEVAGTLAGDNTIFVMFRNIKKAEAFVRRIDSMVRIHE